MSLVSILFLCISAILFIGVILLKIKVEKLKLNIDNLQEKNINFIKLLEEEKKEIENVELESTDKNFKFIAINQMIKTLVREKDLETLERIIADMLFEVESIEKGAFFRIENEKLKLIVDKGFDVKKDDIKILNNGEFIKKLLSSNLIKNIEILDVEELKENIDFTNSESGYTIAFKGLDDDSGNQILRYVMVLGEKKFGEYSETDIEFLETISGQIEIVLENAIKSNYIEKKNVELTEKIYDLMTINYATKMIFSTLNLDEILKNSIDMFAEVAGTTQAAIAYFDQDTKELEIKNIRGDINENLIGEKIVLDKEDIEFVKENEEIFIITNLKKSDNGILKFYRKHKEFFKKINIEVLVPLIAKNNFFGFIFLGMKYAEKGYSENNVEVYNTLASQISVSVANSNLYNLAITDGMTKLYIHRYFRQRLTEEIERGRRYKKKLSILMTDIDHFKIFNDTYGHQAGDEVLKAVARVMMKKTRKVDIVARYGGEEFVVILPETDRGGAIQAAENIRKEIEKLEIVYNGEILKVNMSLGVYTFDFGNETLSDEEFIKRSDIALYYSKENGRNRVTHYDNIKE
ncbi:sensor domain-containing diguanylate cyclase [Haliovirga abyssi]|uniref:GGDEF domain-containing protein n=1 Tax=Haliovirga abyssi TaxID=2996794 RepID=A0AAU9DR07_9FUSO|nr:diguanylate cyclase [Haliovirga abyssi]BDU50968.1 hypothetical protein HLVA_15370 [Haliovirga abyssi]